MFDIGWSEMALIAVVAIVVIGPKDLPKLLRTLGQFTAKARSMAREFQTSIEDLAREAEVDELKKDVAKLAQFDIKNEIETAVDPGGDIRKSLTEVDQTVRDFERSDGADPSAPPPLPQASGPVDLDSVDPPAEQPAAIEPPAAPAPKSASG